MEGKFVRLEKDISDKDKFGRPLRYVYVVNIDPETGKENEIFVNLELAAQGYAYASSYPPDVKYQEIFLEAQRQAIEFGRGLWKECERNTILPAVTKKIRKV